MDSDQLKDSEEFDDLDTRYPYILLCRPVKVPDDFVLPKWLQMSCRAAIEVPCAVCRQSMYLGVLQQQRRGKHVLELCYFCYKKGVERGVFPKKEIDNEK